MLGNLFQKFVRSLDLEVFLHRELSTLNRCTWVDLLLQLIHVAHGHVEVVLQTSLHQQIIELSYRVVQVIDVCQHVLVILLKQLCVPANTDQLTDKRLFQKEVLWCVTKLDQATVDL